MTSLKKEIIKNNVCDICGLDVSIRYNQKTRLIYSPKVHKTLCLRHYTQLRYYGKFLEYTRFDKNEYEIIENKYAEIILKNAKHEEVARTIIDIEDLEKVLKTKWRFEKSWGYVSSNSEEKYILLQNFILNKKGLIDHIDRNPLNNRKNNLVPSNKSLNAHNAGLRSNNSSGVTGVSFHKGLHLWRSYITWNKKRIELGFFKDFKTAVQARLNKEKEFLGNSAPQKHFWKEFDIQ